MASDAGVDTLTTMTEMLETLPDSESAHTASNPPGILYRVLDAVNITTDNGALVPLRCNACGQHHGPWLLAAYPGIATVTCQCGHRGTHPQITQQAVEQHAEGFEAMFPSLDAAEAHLGFAGPSAAGNADPDASPAR